MTRFLGRYAPHLYGVLRIIAGMMYWMHGTQKLLAWPIGAGGRVGETVPLMSMLGAAGVIEVVGGFMIMTGLYASWAGFICSGEMAFAYFLRQLPIAILPIFARPGILGESAIFNCFFFLYVAAKGSGMLSLDNVLGIGDCKTAHTGRD